MSQRLDPRPNDEWISALRGTHPDSAPWVEELADYLERILRSTLSKRALEPADLADLAQEALLRLVESLHTFRGDCAFPTWAAAVATRVAFTELRRRDARETKHAAFRAAHADALVEGVADESAEEHVEAHEQVIRALHRSIETELTGRQRTATLALLRGVPTIEIAEQMDSNQNAIYKLVHDARLRLRTALEQRGVTCDVISDVLSGGPAR